MLFYDLFRHEPNILKISAGETLFRAGDASNGLMYVLVAGKAHIAIGEQIVEHCQLGAILGEMAMIEDAPRSATVVCDTDCSFAEIDQKRFHFLVTDAPFFAIEVMRVMAQRLRSCDSLLTNRVPPEAPQPAGSAIEPDSSIMR